MYSKGQAAEDKAKQIYLSKGYTILEQNWRYYGVGKGQKAEIDLVARHKNILIFVEVKFRTTKFAPIQESITRNKINLLRTAAQAYIVQHPTLGQLDIRFDAIFIYHNDIEIIENIE